MYIFVWERSRDTLLNRALKGYPPTYLGGRLNIYERHCGWSRIKCSSELPSQKKVGVKYIIRSFIICTLCQILVGQSNPGIWIGRNIYYESDTKCLTTFHTEHYDGRRHFRDISTDRKIKLN
jgi:hypothetical protein